MEYSKELKAYGAGISDKETEALAAQALEALKGNLNSEVYKTCLGCADITSLNAADSEASITELTRKVLDMPRQFPGVPGAASVCVFPPFIETVGLAAGDSGLRITSVAGGFPSSQTFLEVKMLEAAMAVESGADEIDVVINVGQILSGEYEQAASEIEILAGEVGEDTVLKVILESGELVSAQNIRTAALLAMMAGADFIKTSTGRTPVGATPQAAVTMCLAIKEYSARTGRKVGFKVAGGVRTAQDAALYYTIVENILGAEWLTPSLFRIGTSSAANSLLGEIVGKEVAYF